MTRVFVIQQPAYYDPAKGKFVDKCDLTPASAFGELVFLLPPGNIFRDRLTSAAKTIREKLEEYTPDDFIMCVGDPIAIAIAAMAAASQAGGSVRMLKWDRKRESYDSFIVNV